MDVLAPVRAFDRVQRRHRALALPVAVLKKFSDDQAGNLAAVMAYYAFFSLFPLLLVFTTVLGFVLADNPQAQKDILNSTLDQIPLVGDELKTGTLQGSGVALAVGLVVTLLVGPRRDARGPDRVQPHLRRADARAPGPDPLARCAAWGCSSCWARCRSSPRSPPGSSAPGSGRAADRRRGAARPGAEPPALRRRLPDADRPQRADPDACGPASWRPRCCGRPCRASAAPTWATSSATRARPTGRSRRSSGC